MLWTIDWLFDWLVLSANSSNISGISWHELTTSRNLAIKLSLKIIQPSNQKEIIEIKVYHKNYMTQVIFYSTN